MASNFKYTVLGVNSGIGVSLFPFRNKLVGNIEIRPIFHTIGDIQWRNNFGDIPLYKKFDLVSANYPDIKDVDVIISSPDCGSGSILRYSRSKELGNHRKNVSLRVFFEAIQLYKPKFFEFENLDGLFKSFPEAEFDEILSEYWIIKHVASVACWGNSQLHRKRLVIIGVRRDQNRKILKHFKLPNYRDRIKTCGELYGDLDIPENSMEGVAIGNVRENTNQATTIYAGRKLFNFQITDIWRDKLKKSKRWTDCPNKKFSSAPGVYRNRLNDYPATARKASRQYDHNGYMLTPRQLARIQGVPDEFILHIDEAKLNYWINKGRAAVTKTPPYEISMWFRKKLNKTLKLGLWK